MERTITITLEKAKEWYNSDNESLKEVALQAFSKEELDIFDFTKIKTFEDALNALKYTKTIKICIRDAINDISIFSKASAAMAQLNIIRKALNLDQDLHLTKDPKDSHIYYPRNPFVTRSCAYYVQELNSHQMEIIGRIKSEGIEYNVLGGSAIIGNPAGLGNFNAVFDVGLANACLGFLGCATKEIAQHFSKYFGMLITEAKYGDIVDFEIVESKYQ